MSRTDVKGSQPSPLETHPKSLSSDGRGSSGSGVDSSVAKSPHKAGSNGAGKVASEAGAVGEQPGKGRELQQARATLRVLDQESDEAQVAMQAANAKVEVAMEQVVRLEEQMQELLTLKIKADLTLKKALNEQERARRDVAHVELLWAQAVDKVTLLASSEPSPPPAPSSPSSHKGAVSTKVNSAEGGCVTVLPTASNVVIQEESNKEDGQDAREGGGADGTGGLALAGGATDEEKKKKKTKKKSESATGGAADAADSSGATAATSGNSHFLCK